MPRAEPRPQAVAARAAGAADDDAAGASLRRLGSMPVGRFLHGYWQRRPLLLRGALTPPAAIGVAEIFALAGREDVESRLVTAFDGRWNLAHGPFRRARLPPRTRPDWTLLVQGVDLVLPQAARLRARFRFLPDARLDDLMVSFATDRGGVGAHVDSYDVFLLQLAGRRRWRIDAERRSSGALRAGLPLQILADFTPSDEWILEPGDMLYLPPGVPHDGTAIGMSLTCSVGFRAPCWQELVEPWHALLAESTDLSGQYGDAGICATRHPARLPQRMVSEAFRRLTMRRPGRDSVAQALLRHMSEPAARVVFDDRPAKVTPARFHQLARRSRLQPDPRSRILYWGQWFAINGEILALPVRDRDAFLALADAQAIDPERLARVGIAALDQLREWYLAGWLRFAAR